MLGTILAVVAVAIAYQAFGIVTSLRRNILAAKRSGLPYVVFPWAPVNNYWLLTCGSIIPLIKKLPRSWWEKSMLIIVPDWAYKNLQTPWDVYGETFIMVSPGRLILFTSSAEVTREVVAHRDNFPKALENYGILRFFGNNVVTSEGQLWKAHRKATAVSFNEKNSVHVFREAIEQTEGMIEKWMGDEDEEVVSSPTLHELEHDTMTLALNIIAYVGFGLRLLWPSQRLPEDADAVTKRYGSLTPPEGHTMSYAQSLATLLDKVLVILLVPTWLIKILPFETTKEAYEGRENYDTYMKELLQSKTEEVKGGQLRAESGMDIMGELVRAQYRDGGHVQSNGKPVDGKAWTPSDSDILGNAFVMLLAGHETSANTLHFTIIELANNPAYQRDLQSDIDEIFGATSDPHTWSYEKNINAMLSSRIGNCINETLRLIPPVVDIPKMVSADKSQVLVIDGQEHVLSPKMDVFINSVGLHRSKKYWPSEPSKITGQDSDVNDYVPDRWYRHSSGSESAAAISSDSHNTAFAGRETFKPVRGSWVPFSDGARSCLGKRVAQVEMVAAVAVLFQKYSVELAVDEWASDEEVDRMGVEEKRALYKKAQEKSRETVKRAGSIITLKLRAPDHVPIRLVRRGKERFVGLGGL